LTQKGTLKLASTYFYNRLVVSPPKKYDSLTILDKLILKCILQVDNQNSGAVKEVGEVVVGSRFRKEVHKVEPTIQNLLVTYMPSLIVDT
jgi:hypothetical protein